MSSPFQRDFLTDLKALDDFLAQRTGDGAFVQREDPDVRRLMESIAFFSTRTRSVALDHMQAAVQRLAGGCLDDLLSPSPARAVIQAIPSERLLEPTFVPRGAPVRIVAADGSVGRFRTMRAVTVMALELAGARLELRPGGGYRVLLRLDARVPVRALPEALALHISFLDDYAASLRFHYAIREQIERATVFYDADTPTPRDTGAPCQITFGTPRDETEPRSAVGDIRSFFHFPGQELYVNVAMAAADKPWRRAWLALDLGDGWPSDLVVNKDVFRLFVIPVENLRRELAQPINADGTQSCFPIRPVDTAARTTVHSIAGVYQEVEEGVVPVEPAQLASGSDSYEIEIHGDVPEQQRHDLLLRLPGAFEAPRAVTVDARWHQPWFDRRAVGKLEVSLQRRHIEGVSWRLHGRIMPHEVSPLWQDSFATLHVLALRSRLILSRDEILSLMKIVGADQDSYHANIGRLVVSITAEQIPAEGRLGGGVKYLYRAVLSDFDLDQRGLVFDYLARVWMLLDAWSTYPVELQLVRQKPKTGKLLTEARWS